MAKPAGKPKPAAAAVRGLTTADLAAVTQLDSALSGRSRSAYFSRRLAAAQREPALHVQFAAVDDGVLRGFLLARVLEGEFGRREPALRLEAIGVAPGAQGRGLGARLARALEDEARGRGVKELRTAASWRQHAMLAFLDRAGWSLGTAQLFDCAPRSDFEPLARDAVDVGVLLESDLEGMLRIDRRLTGMDRGGFLRRALADAMRDSAVRVSLAARADGGLAGFLMARVDLGDFGRPAPVAVIDTIGVDPLRERQGIGRALLSQLFANLGALGIERVETLVYPGDFALQRFFQDAGLRPSERLAFAKQAS
jgi:GNAT superfamily N-acetyltransferase